MKWDLTGSLDPMARRLSGKAARIRSFLYLFRSHPSVSRTHFRANFRRADYSGVRGAVSGCSGMALG
jgi:hypothetical protein